LILALIKAAFLDDGQIGIRRRLVLVCIEPPMPPWRHNNLATGSHPMLEA
jgi:hypothetical protein